MATTTATAATAATSVCCTATSTVVRTTDESTSTSAGMRWYGPFGRSEVVVQNSLTNRKEPLVPRSERLLTWYMCGPTVYDSAHMGHARAYVTFDIIRRILTDYFRMPVNYVMNVTDIDDKIILRARRNHLVQQFAAQKHTVQEVRERLSRAYTSSLDALRRKVDEVQANLATATSSFHRDELTEKLKETQLKLQNVQRDYDRFQASSSTTSSSTTSSSASTSTTASSDTPDALIADHSAALADELDRELGHGITDHSIFREHAARYEREFLDDMRALNVRDVNVLTRVSEYVDKVIEYVQRIIERGHAYEHEGSVYFSVSAFVSGPDAHQYGKLSPASVGNTALQVEADGELSAQRSKRSAQDFALWKASKPGEPSWPSPWGQGRPGWHVECSAMATDVLGSSIDIHSGGVDLKFPHHDNELAQSESYCGTHQWINHFWHAGHLHIHGLKMSKSLKNFITIRQLLEVESWRTVRFLFLLQPWDSTMNFSSDNLTAAKSKENDFNEFFLNTQVVLRAKQNINTTEQRWDEHDATMFARISDTQSAVHAALSDNFNYPLVMTHLSTLIGDVSRYRTRATSKALVLTEAVKYVHDVLRVFGVIKDGEYTLSSGGAHAQADDKVAKLLDAVCAFRDDVRDATRAKTSVLEVCDRFRNDTMIDLGYRLEDGAGGQRSVWKADDPAKLRRERDEKRRAELSERVRKATNKLDKCKKDAEKVEEAKVSAAAFFARQTDKYSVFDAANGGRPTHDQEGKELSKSALKSVAKVWDARDKAHKEYLAKVAATPTYEQDLADEQRRLEDELRSLTAQLDQQQQQ